MMGMDTKKQSYNTASPDRYKLLKEFARHNREYPTDAERMLWSYLSASQMGFKFNRQHIIGDYIGDFVCLEKKLVIELDGGYHYESVQMYFDEQRTVCLERMGFKVVRFDNDEVLNDLDNVLDKIYDELEK